MSAKKIAKIQLPIDAELKKIGEKLAEEEGLSSYQELLRYWTKQAAKGNLVINTSHHEDWISPEKAAEYKKEVEETLEAYKAGKIKAYSSGEELMTALDEMIDEENKKDNNED